MRTSMFLTAITMAGCLVGSGRLEERELPLAGFEAIDAADSFAVEITRGDAFSVRVVADDNVWPSVDARLAGTTLRLALVESEPHSGITLRARVTLPSLRALALSGAARARAEGFAEDALELTLSGASDASLSGEAKTLRLAASGASRATLDRFPVELAAVDLSGASEASVTVLHRIDYRVSGRSDLTIFGRPAVGSREVSGGSEVTER